MKTITMKAYVNTIKGTRVVEIDACDAPFSERELEKCINKFNNDTRVIETVSSVSYHITYKGKFNSARLASSSLDELLEMYKCAWKGKNIPARKCYMIERKQTA